MQAEVPLLTFVIPCLNESRTLSSVIADCYEGGRACGCPFEVIVADNGSTDGSQEIAQSAGAHVVDVPIRGYGAALLAGIRAAKGTYILMGDADSTYEFAQAGQFLGKLQQGYDLVMGNRFKGRIAPGAMPLLHRHLGNPVLSALGRLFFGIKIGDFHCGLRGFNRDAILALNLHCSGMEFASEMVIKSSLMDLRTAEIPTNLWPNPPGRIPHLKTWRDGWRHLKFMLSFSPKFSFLPFTGLLLLMALALLFSFGLGLPPFSGPSTLVFAFSCLVACIGIVSDYLSTREMLYSEYPMRRSGISQRVDSLLGLNRGTDRIFKIAGISAFMSSAGFVALLVFWLQGSLSSRMSSLVTFVTCASLLLSISAYLTAAKISTYRNLHPKSSNANVIKAHVELDK
ncbi:glycosyltransferase family 2 protein [Synechococcus sp. BA-132 BA5]|uniref:glycosyltransferase family 2 protein n=1 Tax=Synechococcus sp. BA-132 BA5 TaxID=3110252 RepID=UPI002B1F0B6B|nr:glycosyltransferase family 2 protein [Synechococcus sp. BA-132 BA5]MEA5414419.1 glycosyltransferase family 2 protein [Synechococcus sp. BA-132 BA5]